MTQLPPPIPLLHCPFCENDDAVIERMGTPRQSTQYACENCGCHLETGEEWAHGRQWNTVWSKKLKRHVNRIKIDQFIELLEKYEPAALKKYLEKGDE